VFAAKCLQLTERDNLGTDYWTENLSMT